MQTENNSFVTDDLSDFLCGYREGFSTQHALIKLIESSRQSLDSRGYSGAVLMDLSKAPVYEKKDSQAKENYRTVSVLPLLSKVFERSMQTENNSFVTDDLSDFLCGYREGFSTQHALIKLIESSRQSLDSRGYSGAVLMDLSKALDKYIYQKYLTQ